MAYRSLRITIADYKKKADRRCGETPHYEPGQKVWVSTKDSRVGSSGKLAAKYEGPYTITGQINEVTYHVGLPGYSRASWAFHMSALNPMVEGPLSKEDNPSSAPPPPLEIEGAPAYKGASSEAFSASAGPAAHQEAGGVFREGFCYELLMTDPVALKNVAIRCHSEAELICDSEAEFSCQSEAEPICHSVAELSSHSEAELSCQSEAELSCHIEAEFICHSEAEFICHNEAELSFHSEAEFICHLEADGWQSFPGQHWKFGAHKEANSAHGKTKAPVATMETQQPSELSSPDRFGKSAVPGPGMSGDQ
ncbi:hypothetical protein P4O66_000710 [Electrophorus voltai]|uniref:Tf2-1-like SH3-like domain-containing protein n=1 Tax=Electrophorus voltai TaxID=2609070 RepID=A0AAD8ZFS4_9TELE|nr:hypothetical protein P4O66_000710 [Electrophorus voltai]